jgi:DNA-binding PadR family transcriptional regulator
LQRAGWIQPTETAREGRRPERTVYSLTEDGSRRFRDRLRELIAEPTGEYSSFEAGLSFMHQLSRGEATELLRLRALALEQRLDAGGWLLGWLQSRGLTRLSVIEAEMVNEQQRWQLGGCGTSRTRSNPAGSSGQPDYQRKRRAPRRGRSRAG